MNGASSGVDQTDLSAFIGKLSSSRIQENPNGFSGSQGYPGQGLRFPVTVFDPPAFQGGLSRAGIDQRHGLFARIGSFWIYRVIEDNRSGHRRELLDSLKRIRQTFENARKYNFTSEELDLGKGFMRLDAVQRVIEGVGFSKEPGHY